MKLIIDRFEGDIAVCETDDGGHVDIMRNCLPEDANEGAVIEERDGCYVSLSDETEARRQRMRELFNCLIEE